jgi:hypothetical protein
LDEPTNVLELGIARRPVMPNRERDSLIREAASLDRRAVVLKGKITT